MDDFKTYVLKLARSHPPTVTDPDKFWDVSPMSHVFPVTVDGITTSHLVLGGWGVNTEMPGLLDIAIDTLEKRIVPWVDAYLRNASKKFGKHFKFEKAVLYKGDNPEIQRHYRHLPGVELSFTRYKDTFPIIATFYDGEVSIPAPRSTF